MNIVVIGLGSMGRRRIRLLKKYNDTFNIIGVDLNTERRAKTKSEFAVEAYEHLDEVLQNNDINCAFICTSPLSHSDIINQCLRCNLHVFTELNLVADLYDENITLSKAKNKILFLSSTFLHRAEINQIQSWVKSESFPLNYIYHIGQYLPDWHPWEDYKDFFVADKRSNGCREIFAIELPWIIEVFGKVKDMLVNKSKISSLNVDYNDNYMVILEHESGHKGMLAVDVVSRKAVRNLEVFGENLHFSWNGSPDGLKVWDVEKRTETHVELYDNVDRLNEYSNFVVENAYYEEIVSFFNAIEKIDEPIYSFEKDKEILRLIDRIEA